MICEDTLVIVHGFDISKKIHDPVLIQAQVNKIQASAVRQEIIQKEQGFDVEVKQLEAQIQNMQKQADEQNPSSYWNLLPLAGAAYFLFKKKKYMSMKKE